MADGDSILAPGRNCWLRAPARRAAFLVDGANYFAALDDALGQARRSIFIIGWDIHSRLQLRPKQSDQELWARLDGLARRHRDLQVRILIWDGAPIYQFEREFMPQVQLGWRTHRRVDFALAADHPTGSSHHQKMVVIDDTLAFVGGLDLTTGRWDTREHLIDDEHRHFPQGGAYPPFHDVHMAVEGEVAARLGELARARWGRSTGEQLPPPAPVDAARWPKGLEPDLENIEVAVVRSDPGWPEPEPIREVEALYLDAIAAAKQSLYLENQYLTSNSVCSALAATLAEPKGPEVLIVTPRECTGRLERVTMGYLHDVIVGRLRDADAHGRLRVVYPSHGDQRIHVHAKVMVVDDRLVRVGSSNLTTRSMRLDTECDLAIEADSDATRAVIRRFRDGLLGEHLGVSSDVVAEAVGAHGLLGALDQLAGHQSRTLSNTEPRSAPNGEPFVAHLVDAAEPLDIALVDRALPGPTSKLRARAGVTKVVIVTAIALALAAAWAWTPLSDWADAERLAAALQPIRHHPWGPVAAGVGVVIASLAIVPITILISASVMLFGPWVGALTAATGAMVSAAAGYGLGRLLRRSQVARVAGGRLSAITEKLGRQGVVAVTLVRMVPLAPFTVVNLVLGSAHVPFSHYMAGTLIGLTPGIIALAVTTDRVVAAIRDPDAVSIIVAAVVVVLMFAGLYAVRRLLQARRQKPKD